MAKFPKLVENVKADDIVRTVQSSIKSSRPDRDALQTMMDMITGVRKYEMHDLQRQGIIAKFFDKEIKRPKSAETGNQSNFSLGLEDIVSIFWENVFKDLDKAKFVGDTVQVRIVDGQTSDSEITEKDGMRVSTRKTNCNAIYFLRWNGLTKTRSALTKIYAKNLVQVCKACGNDSAATRSEQCVDCPECKSTNTVKTYPTNSSKYRAVKLRKCMSCLHEWTRKFAYMCISCNSEDVHLEARTHAIDESIYQMNSDEPSIEELHVTHEISRELDQVILAIKSTLPKNPQNKEAVTAGMEIFEMLINPAASKRVCEICVEKSPKVCSVKCKSSDCSHTQILDKNVSCGAASFSMATCVNYSRKIADYHNCSASLTSRRVKTDRQYFVRYVVHNRHSIDACASLYSMMKQRGLIDDYL